MPCAPSPNAPGARRNAGRRGRLRRRPTARPPWWIYADSDAVYVSSALNMVLGTGTKFFDHPGLPLQQLAALTFELRRWVLGAPPAHGYVNGLLLDLDATRPYYRAYGVLLFFAGVLTAFALGRRLGGRAIWGVAAGLLILGAPGLLAMSIQFRADSALPLLLLGGSLLTAEAARRRDSLAYLSAAAVCGPALTFKLSAVPLFVGLAVAAVLRPADDAGGGARLREIVRRHRAPVAADAGVWLGAAVVLNRAHFPFRLTASQLGVVTVLVGGACTWAVAARAVGRGPFRPFYAAIGAAVVAGLLAPVTLRWPTGSGCCRRSRAGSPEAGSMRTRRCSERNISASSAASRPSTRCL